MGVFTGLFGGAPFEMPAVESAKALDVGVSRKREAGEAVEVTGIELVEDASHVGPWWIPFYAVDFIDEFHASEGGGHACLRLRVRFAWADVCGEDELVDFLVESWVWGVDFD